MKDVTLFVLDGKEKVMHSIKGDTKMAIFVHIL